MIRLSGRISGSLFGLLLCDALGTAVEGQAPGSFDLVTTLRGGGKFRLKPGQFTDDGSMALCLAIALLGDVADTASKHQSIVQMNLYRRWYETGYLSSTGECFDIGMTVRNALNKFVSHFNQNEGNDLSNTTAYYGNPNPHASGNGSLMRLAPVALLYHRNPIHAMAEAVNSSKTTHGSLLCLDSCRVYTALIIGALQGSTKEELLNSEQIYVPAGLPNNFWTTEINSSLEPSVLAVMKGSYKHRDPPEIKASGFVIETMEAALWAFYHTDSFEEGALRVVNLGDDSDTVGAVYGMLAGAYYGLDSIPTDWREKCSFQSLVQTIADELVTQSENLKMSEESKADVFNKPTKMYKRVLNVYNSLAAFYSGTIKRRVLPCPKQYKSAQEFDEDIVEFHKIYEQILDSIKSSEISQESTANVENDSFLIRSDSILKQFLALIEEDKRLLSIKWSRNLNHIQLQKHFISSNTT